MMQAGAYRTVTGSLGGRMTWQWGALPIDWRWMADHWGEEPDRGKLMCIVLSQSSRALRQAHEQSPFYRDEA